MYGWEAGEENFREDSPVKLAFYRRVYREAMLGVFNTRGDPGDLDATATSTCASLITENLYIAACQPGLEGSMLGNIVERMVKLGVVEWTGEICVTQVCRDLASDTLGHCGRRSATQWWPY